MTDLNIYRREAIKAAKQLLYGDDTICKLKATKTIAEITNVMKTTRDKEDTMNEKIPTNTKKSRRSNF